MEFYQSRAHSKIQIICGSLIAFVGAFQIYLYQTSSDTFDIVTGVILILSFFAINWSLLKRRLVFKETPDGFIARGSFNYRTIRWDQLVAIGDRNVSDRMILLVWKNKPSEKDKFFAMPRLSAEEEDIEKILDLIMEHRPDLPTYSRGKINAHDK